MRNLVKFLWPLLLCAVICIAVTGCGQEKGEDVCTVTFNTNGGTPEAIDPIKVAKGGTMGIDFPSTSKTGYRFLGWYNETDKYTESTPILKNVVLKAKWEITTLGRIFGIFNTFKDENYSPPSGFDARVNGVSYGTITEKTYYSTTTTANRKCNVYTPPGYDPNETYPVLYLLHGIGGTHNEWKNDGGKPNEIISNLINSDQAKPMIVVMPNVRAMKNDGVPSNQTSAEAVAAFHNFINDLRDDLMPFIKENYSVSDDRGKIAIAGLSMGAMESLHIGCRMYETIGYIGSFSAAPAMPLTAAQMTIPDQFKENTFFMLCCGLQDGLISQSQNYNQYLTNNGVRTAYYTIPGGHDWTVWNNGLYYFARCIF